MKATFTYMESAHACCLQFKSHGLRQKWSNVARRACRIFVSRLGTFAHVIPPIHLLSLLVSRSHHFLPSFPVQAKYNADKTERLDLLASGCSLSLIAKEMFLHSSPKKILETNLHSFALGTHRPGTWAMVSLSISVHVFYSSFSLQPCSNTLSCCKRLEPSGSCATQRSFQSLDLTLPTGSSKTQGSFLLKTNFSWRAKTREMC